MEPSRLRFIPRSPVEQTLMAAIGWGDLAAGVVYSAAELSRRYAATPSQVRASMQSLERAGLVATVPRRGFQVTEPNAEELRDLVELRLSIEVPAARAAAESGLSDQDSVTVRALADATMAAAVADDLLEYIRSDLDFHLHIVALGGDHQMVEVVRLLRIRSRIPGIRPVARSFMIENAEEHLVMADLLADGEGAGMDDLLRRHIIRVVQS